MGRELVGCVGGDALPAAGLPYGFKRGDPLRASWHILVPSAEAVREASVAEQRSYGMWDVVQVRIFGVSAASLQSGWAWSTARLGKKPRIFNRFNGYCKAVFIAPKLRVKEFTFDK